MIKHKDWDINEHATGRFRVDPETKRKLPIIGATFQNGLNDIEPDGSFVPCDVRISEATQGVTYLEMNRGRMGELRFGDSSHPNSFLVKIKNKSLKGISFKYTGATGSSMTANNGKPLCHFDNGISIESTPYYKGVKMDIIVNDPLNAPIEYPFSIKTYGQDYVFVEENGGATLRGEDQASVFIKPPYAEDANGDIGPVTIHYTGIENNLITFKKVVDEAWLRQAAAPVRIDPDVTIEDGVDGGVIEDNWMQSSVPNANRGTSIFLALATYASPLIYVDLSVYADVTPISGKFLCTGLNTSAVNGKAYKLLKSFNELQSTWNVRETGVNWQTPGAKGVTDRATIEEYSFSSPSVQYEILDIPITVSTLIEWLSINYGVLLEYTGGGVQWNMGSAEHATYPIRFYFEYTEGVEALGLLRRGLGQGLNRGLGGGL